MILTQNLQVKPVYKKLYAQPSGTILIKTVFSPSSDTQVGFTGCPNQVLIIVRTNRVSNFFELGWIRSNVGEEIRHD